MVLSYVIGVIYGRFCCVVESVLVVKIIMGMYSGSNIRVSSILECWVLVVSVISIVLSRLSIGVVSISVSSRIGIVDVGNCSMLVSIGVIMISGSVVVS